MDAQKIRRGVSVPLRRIGQQSLVLVPGGIVCYD